MAEDTSNTKTKPKRSFRRRMAFRLMAVLIGLIPFVIAEIVLAMLDIGRPELQDDPFVGFSSVRPLFVLNEESGRYEIPETRQDYFRPDSFEAKKPADEFRIFCIGGSTVQGRPYAIETSFTTWLELSLQAAQPKRRWEVVNCGGVSYASYRLIPILEEVLNYEPDLIIVCTGQNEFLEDRTYDHIKNQSSLFSSAQKIAMRSRCYCLLRKAYLAMRSDSPKKKENDKPKLNTEVDAMLDYEGGLSKYHRDEGWRRGVVEHYQHNLNRIVQLTRESKTPLMFVNPVSNLRDCPPFKSEHRSDLTDGQRRKWDEIWEQARASYATNLHESAALFEEAAKIDDLHAGLFFQLGKCYDTLGEVEKARQAYLLAKELDICPLRMLDCMHDSLLLTATETNTPIVDARELLKSQCRDNILDDSALVDHVHPSINGHQLIAQSLFDELQRQGIVTPGADWEKARDAQFDEHFTSLDDTYFFEGRRRLDGLKRWASGRASRKR